MTHDKDLTETHRWLWHVYIEPSETNSVYVHAHNPIAVNVALV